ncbi:hypothetical protein D3C79_580200 [compost metagenome]
MASRIALFIKGLLVQAYQACTEHGLPLLIEADPVVGKQPVLTAVQAAGAVANGFVRRRQYRCRLVDVAAADHFVEVGTLIQRTTLGAGANRQVVAQAHGLETSIERRLCFIGAAGVVGAAEVIDVVVAFRAEVVRHAGSGAARGAIAAPGE